MRFFSRPEQYDPAKNRQKAVSSGAASPAMVDFASETFRFIKTVERCVPGMDPIDGERFLNQYEWYLRKIQTVLGESGLSIVDLTGQTYDIGMAVSPLNLEDFPELPNAQFRIAQMVEPIIMENGKVRKTGSVMLELLFEDHD